MIEKIVGDEISPTFAKLRSRLTGKDCVIISEESPVSVVVKHGSVWGISPKHAKKTVKYDLSPEGSGTRVTASSKIASDWMYLAVGGCILAIVLAAIFFRISIDLKGFEAMDQLSWWGWLVTTNGHVDGRLAQAFGDLLQFFAVFLLVVTGAEVVVVSYAYSRVDLFAKGSLDSIV